jgi:hypothetical protein
MTKLVQPIPPDLRDSFLRAIAAALERYRPRRDSADGATFRTVRRVRGVFHDFFTTGSIAGHDGVALTPPTIGTPRIKLIYPRFAGQ